ncbi:hypothetical protein EYF80_009531 [Liparis tanakae]|uniref:Uncharacterized protein n=1 Tax=Liparis tanakae TaxID=230148 RepID=A0A4Z2IQR6_9TELE|nr:hypothetical protein EYF80_009531 [Liparis tanakae]
MQPDPSSNLPVIDPIVLLWSPTAHRLYTHSAALTRRLMKPLSCRSGFIQAAARVRPERQHSAQQLTEWRFQSREHQLLPLAFAVAAELLKGVRKGPSATPTTGFICWRRATFDTGASQAGLPLSPAQALFLVAEGAERVFDEIQTLGMRSHRHLKTLLPLTSVAMTAAHSSIPASTNTSGGAPGVAGTLDLTTGKEGEVLAQTLSFCLQGHSCLIGGSHCLVWHEAVCVPDCHPAGGQASQLPCDGSFRQRVSTCHQPCTQSYHGGGYSVPVGGQNYKQRVMDLHLSDIHRKEKSTKTDTTAADNRVSSSFDQKKMNDSYVSRV